MRTAESLLRISRPEELFAGDADKAKQQYRELAKEWHPDKNKGDAKASEVFAHVNVLYDAAVERLAKGLWEAEGLLKLKTKSGSALSITYLRKLSFELGQMYVGDDHVTYLVDDAHKQLFENAEHAVRKFKFASDRMQTEISRYLPGGVGTFQLSDGRLGMRIPKTPDLLLLRDVLTHFNDVIEPKHVAWIQNTIHNLSCYLSWAGLVHHHISPDTYFISPEYHSGALLGGWWFAVKKGEAVSQLPKRTLDYLPWNVRTQKKAHPHTDLELIRATGRECLGDITGIRLAKNGTPAPMNTWLQSTGDVNAVDAYTQWGEVLKASFGPRKFVKLSLNAATLYAKK